MVECVLCWWLLVGACFKWVRGAHPFRFIEALAEVLKEEGKPCSFELGSHNCRQCVLALALV